jgi:hypothetical protein
MGTGSRVRSPSCRYAQGRSALGQESSEFATPLRRERGSWPYSSGSTSHVGSHQADYTAGSETGSSSSMESSRSHPECRRNRLLCACAGRELSRRVSHRHATILVAQCRIAYARSPVGVRKRGGHSVVDWTPCISRRREESMPKLSQQNCPDLGLTSGIRTLIAACSDLAISLSCSNLGLLPSISGSQNWPTAPFMCPIFPWLGAGARTH